MGNVGAVAEPGRHRHVADRGPDAGQPCQASGERGADPRAFGELHVVVGADVLLCGHDRRGAGVPLDGRMGAEHRFELHAPGHREHGRGEEGDQGAGERAEAAAGAEDR